MVFRICENYGIPLLAEILCLESHLCERDRGDKNSIPLNADLHSCLKVKMYLENKSCIPTKILQLQYCHLWELAEA